MTSNSEILFEKKISGKGSILAVVNPFICNRNIGLWNDDELVSFFYKITPCEN